MNSRSAAIFRVSLALVMTLLLAVSTAIAGPMHARSVIGLGVSAQFAPHGGIAHAERHQGSKYRVSHEEFGNNYTYGNAGSGHAHHHGGAGRAPAPEPTGPEPTPEQRKQLPPVAGSRGTAQYVRQTWRPSAAGDTVQVTWMADNFLQIDPSDIRASRKIASKATIAATGGLAGTVEISAQRERGRKPKIDTRLTGIFEKAKFRLVTHRNGVVSMHFTEPLSWQVKANADTFDIALDATIEGVEEAAP